MKKVIVAAIAIVLFIVLAITTFLGEEEKPGCEGPGDGGGADAVVNGDFAYPTDKSKTNVSSPFGPRVDPINGGQSFHNGIDLAGPKGTPIYAFADGDVVAAADSGVQGFGGWVVLNHKIDGKQIQTVYGHSEPGQVHVKVGDKVKKGQHIADMGTGGESTGDHLHFEVIEGDRAAGGKHVDPQPWLDKAGKTTPGKGGSTSSGGTTGGGSASGADVVLIGDSLSVRAEEQLKKELPGVKINAEVGRQFSEGLSILERDKPEAKTVVMALGTNGPFDQSAVDRAKKAAGGAKLVLMTVGGPNVPSADAVNKLVEDNAGDVGVADWAAAVKDHPDYISDDGIHQSPAGTDAFAHVIADAVSGSGGSSSSRGGKSSGGSTTGAVKKMGKNPNENKDVPLGVAPSNKLDEFQINHVRRIIAEGKKQGADKKVIKAAIMAAGHESGLRMLASRAVPESLTMPNDGVTPGDATSVGLFQIQVPMNMPVKDGMDPEKQVQWFFTTAKQMANPSDPEWKIAADTERPREDLRGLYQQWESAAQKLLDGNADIAPSGDECAPGGDSDDGGATPANASEFAKKAIAAARKQKGQPYVWGGGDANGPTSGQGGGQTGFDCSGLTLYAYAQASGGKIKLPHFTGGPGNPGQLGAPELKEVPMSDVQAGDLVFFGSPTDTHHVGLAIDNKTMIHAPTFGQTVTEAPIKDMGDFAAVRRLKSDALK